MGEVVGVLESEAVTQAHAIGIRSSSVTVIVRPQAQLGMDIRMEETWNN